MEIDARDLPKLSTSTAATTPTVSSSSKSKSSTSTSYTATVTPPSAAGNPNIWNPNHRPDGTIFIAVGSIVGAIIAAAFLWWIVTSYISRRTARKAFRGNLEGQFRSHIVSPLEYDHDDDKEMFLSMKNISGSSDDLANRSKVNLLSTGGKSKSDLRDSTSWDSLPEFQPNLDIRNPLEKTSAIEDNFPNHYKRNSLFVSPTIEVLQQQHGSRAKLREQEAHSKTLSSSSMTASSDDLNKPERAASPERKPKKTPVNTYHKRNNSSIVLSQGSPSKDSAGHGKPDFTSNQTKGHRKKTPSMYLEDMLGGKESL